MTSPAELRAILGDPPGVPADRIESYFAAIAAGADAAPPSPAGALDRARQLLGPAILASSRTQAGRAA